MTTAPCSCGVPNCPELGWPHEWDPIEAGDTCLAQEPTIHHITVGGVRVNPPHLVEEPYVRFGSGYACEECAEANG